MSDRLKSLNYSIVSQKQLHSIKNIHSKKQSLLDTFDEKIDMMLRICLVFYFLINIISTSYCQTDTLLNSIDTIYFKAFKIEEKLSKVTSSVSIISVNQELSQNVSLQEHITEVPGLFSLNANNYAQDLRISIRGFGARSPFGIRGVKIIVDGIPETTPDGQGQIDNLNLSLIKDIEVIKGPASVFYGNASGGVININTLNSLSNTLYGEILMGSFGLQKYNLTFSKRINKTQFLLNGNHIKSNGYREHSEYKSSNVQFKLSHDVSSKFNLKANASYTNSPLANDPGGINIDIAREDRKSARDRNVIYNSGEAIRQYKLSTSANYKIKRNQNINSFAYISGRNFDGRLPFEFGGSIDLDRIYWGHGSNYSIKSIYDNSINTIKLGYEIGFQNDTRLRYKNVEGTNGDLTLDQVESFNNISFYVLDKFDIDKLSFNAGLRYDINRISVADNFISNGDQSDEIKLNAFNPSIGLNYQIAQNLNVYTNYRTSFETPVLSELSANPNGQGGFNSNLKPQKAQNVELGIRSSLFNKFNIDLTYFYISTKDDLVSYELPMDDLTYFENAGKTKRSGLELSIDYTINSFLSIKGYFTSTRLKFDDFESNGVNFNGKTIPGVPNNYGGIIAKGHIKKRIDVSIESVYRGELFINNDNSINEKSVFILNAKINSEVNIGKLTVIPFVAINNITNSIYSDNIRINAFGGRYYEPAPESNFMLGLKFKL